MENLIGNETAKSTGYSTAIGTENQTANPMPNETERMRPTRWGYGSGWRWESRWGSR